jgi:LysR family transcriptional regulator, benzoate and cis,cis-muconate-responsive activator of ben and cat genes
LVQERTIEGSEVGLQIAEAELEFRQLEYFVGVAEELHFGRAAARMFISQPGLSQAIAGLERTLDVKLFVRTRQNVELTDAGTELLRHARAMLADREAAVAGVRRVDRGEAGVLRVGVALLAEHEVAPAFAALGSECPELLLDRSAAVSERLIASLISRDLHAAVVHQVPALMAIEDVEWEVLRHGRLAALVSERSELAAREVASLSELSEETFLVPPRELAPSAFEGLETMCRTYGPFEPAVLELSALGADWRPVIDGEAVALMADGTAQTIAPEGTVAVTLEAPPPFLLAIAWRRGNGSPMLQRFLDFVRTYRDEHAWAEEPVPAA